VQVAGHRQCGADLVAELDEGMLVGEQQPAIQGNIPGRP